MSHDTLLHRALRRPVGVMVDTRVTPDSLTALRLATGLAAGACFAGGILVSIGAVLAFASALLDRADGELARQSRRSSRFGASFHLLADCTAAMAIFIGLGLGNSAALPVPGIVLGVLAALSVAVVFALIILAPPASDHASASRRAFDPDDMMLLVPLAVWCGASHWVLLAGGLVTPALAVPQRRGFRIGVWGRRLQTPI